MVTSLHHIACKKMFCGSCLATIQPFTAGFQEHTLSSVADACGAGGQTLMSSMSLHRLSGRLHEMQKRSRTTALKADLSQDLLTNEPVAPAESEPQRDSFEQTGNTVIDMVNSESRESPETSMNSITSKSRPAMAVASEAVAEGNKGTSSTWLLAAQSFVQPSAGDPGTTFSLVFGVSGKG